MSNPLSLEALHAAPGLRDAEAALPELQVRASCYTKDTGLSQGSFRTAAFRGVS
jgi:hypothetical protein